MAPTTSGIWCHVLGEVYYEVYVVILYMSHYCIQQLVVVQISYIKEEVHVTPELHCLSLEMLEDWLPPAYS